MAWTGRRWTDGRGNGSRLAPVRAGATAVVLFVAGLLPGCGPAGGGGGDPPPPPEHHYKTVKRRWDLVREGASPYQLVEGEARATIHYARKGRSPWHAVRQRLDLRIESLPSDQSVEVVLFGMSGDEEAGAIEIRDVIGSNRGGKARWRTSEREDTSVPLSELQGIELRTIYDRYGFPPAADGSLLLRSTEFPDFLPDVRNLREKLGIEDPMSGVRADLEVFDWGSCDRERAHLSVSGLAPGARVQLFLGGSGTGLGRAVLVADRAASPKGDIRLSYDSGREPGLPLGVRHLRELRGRGFRIDLDGKPYCGGTVPPIGRDGESDP